METETLILPDNTVIDTTQPPPGFNFPKPDFTEIVQDHSDKSEGPLLKPTFKSALQAKKRLQAFSSTRSTSLPSSPKKTKPNSDEKNEETSPKKTPKKGNSSPVKTRINKSNSGHSHDDKAKAVIEEIEELKREEQQAYFELQRQSVKRSRTRSRTPDKGRFKKVDKKSRNYRRRSPTPEKTRKGPKKPKPKKYPRNWREFQESDSNFNVNRDFEVAVPVGNNELLRQVLFEPPSLQIVPFKMKTVSREDKTVPFQYIRYTRTKPVVPYSANFGAIKETFLPKKVVLDSLPKDIVANIENLYSNSLKFPPNVIDSKEKKSKIWYPKVWKDSENECKILEKSVGLSFLQTYTGEEEETDVVEEESRPVQQKIEKIEKPVQDPPKIEEITEKEEPKQKKKKTKKEDEKSEDKKKKKRLSKEKKKLTEETSTEATPKKKKRKKDKSKKKEKHVKDKKHKHKKSKDKKKKSHREEEKVEKADKPTKQQVIEELKQIEEKLAKKREEEKLKTTKEEKTRKRKHSEREDDAKKTKHEKHKKTSGVETEEKIEHPLKKKLEKAKKYEAEVKKENKEEKKAKVSSEDHAKKSEDHAKKKAKNESAAPERKRKSRWSEPIVPKEENDFENLQIVEEIEETVEKKNEDFRDEGAKEEEEEEIKESTPDTDEYHSHWESDDDISSSVPRQSLKLNRSWESDEELFERSHNRNKTQAEYTNLEIPLNIKNFSRRSSNWDEKSISVVDELKLLEEERRSISEERKKLELEKQKILKMQEEVKLDTPEEKEEVVEQLKNVERMRSPEEIVKVKKEKTDDFSIDSLNNSLLSTVSSTESNFPIAVLENEYEEFIKAVSTESSVTPKKKQDRRSSSSSSSSWSSDSDHKKKKRKSKLKKKKKKKKSRDCEGLLLGKGNHIFNEFDIPVPSDLPEMVPTPVPVPSPILPLDAILPVQTSNLMLTSLVDVQDKSVVEELELEVGLDLTKPFVFSSIVLPSKKNPLVDNYSSFNLNDESDSVDFTDKFVKKPEDIEPEDIEPVVEEKIKIEEDQPPKDIEPKAEEIQEIQEIQVEKPSDPVPAPKPIDDLADVPLPPEKPAPILETKIKRSRSISPRRSPLKHREKRRSRSRSRDRRSPIRRRDSSPRRRHSSPRRRSPPRRRGSPRRRSPSPWRRSSPPRRRRRSPSMTPPRSRGGLRKRTPSPRIRRASPLNSPLDGFKRSVADSTISDDMLPQPTPDDYSESPPSYGGGIKYYDRKTSKRSSLSPQLSPKRIPLDDRISLVLGLEKNDQLPPPHKQQDNYQNYNYNNNYGQYPQYNQYGTAKNDYVATFGPMMYTQPPPAIVKPVPTPTKVVQVGNILQVVPTEDVPPPVIVETKTPPERIQKIVQVGNMLQIVPGIMPATKPPILEIAPQAISKPVPPPTPQPEKQSAEAVMKQNIAERKAEREKRRQERERRRKEKEKKRKEKEKRKQMKLKIKTENMIKRAIQIETEALANEDAEEEGDNSELPVQWPPVPVVVSTTPSCKGILLAQGSSGKRKSVQFADGVRPGEGTSPSGGEELSSPPPNPRKLPKEKRYKKLKIPKKSKKKKVRVKVVKKVQQDEDEDDEDEANLPPPSPPPGSPPPHVFPSRVKTHTINNVHQYVGNIIQSNPTGFPFRSPMPVVINRHQPPPGYMPGAYPTDVNSLSHPPYQGVSSHH